jgi:hypothetical protein
MKGKIAGMVVAALLAAAAPVGAQSRPMTPADWKDVSKNLDRYDWLLWCEAERRLDSEHPKLLSDMNQDEILRWLNSIECADPNFGIDWKMRERGLQELTPIM